MKSYMDGAARLRVGLYSSRESALVTCGSRRLHHTCIFVFLYRLGWLLTRPLPEFKLTGEDIENSWMRREKLLDVIECKKPMSVTDNVVRNGWVV